MRQPYGGDGRQRVVVIRRIGGRLFDAIGPHAVFEMVGTITVLVVLFGLWVRWKAPGPLKPERGGVELGV